jgi:hypothetical protein
MTRSLLAHAALLSATLVLGCATPAEEDDAHSFDEGWVAGTVVRLVPGAGLADPGFWQCTRGMATSQVVQGSYVIVRFARRARPRTRLVFAPPDLVLAPDEPVWLNLQRCELAVEARQPGAAAPADPH